MEVEITILKFDEVSKRKELKRPTWFALSNDIFSHPDFFNLSASEFRCWIWILTVASKMNKSKIRIDSEVFAHQCRCKENVFFATIDKLNGKRIGGEISPSRDHKRAAHGDKCINTLQNRTEHTLHTEQVISTVVSELTPAQQLNLFDSIPEKTKERWRKLYVDQEFLDRETSKALVYYESNPRKCPKSVGGWIRALNSWYSRGWEYRAKNTPPNKPKELDFSVLKKAGA